MQHRKLLSLILLSLFPILTHQALFDDSQTGKAGTALSSTPCNKNSINDFTFSSSSSLTCSGSSCSTSSPSLNYVSYLDNTNDLKTYTLSSAAVVSQNVIGGLNYAFLFTFVDATNAFTLYLAVPFDLATNIATKYTYQTINLATTTDSAFSSLQSFSSNPTTTLSAGIPLSAFNFLTSLNYNQFYSVMDSGSNVFLVSKVLLQVSSTSGLWSYVASTALASFSANYAGSGAVLCWGEASGGQFQTHMRESVPLWFFLICVMILWMYVLLSNENTPQVFQRSFMNNKWTSWSLYSLYYLGHQEFFSRLSRGANVLAAILWQAMVVSAIYSVYWRQDGNGIVIWAAAVGWAASVPVPYLLGNIFLKKIYRLESSQLEKKIEVHHQVEKKKREELQRESTLIGEQVYSYSYWYYCSILIMLALFSILSVHVMQSVSSIGYFYRNWHWLISMGAIIGWEHFVLDPILTACFGDREWYQSRGYYYSGEALGELYRKAD